MFLDHAQPMLGLSLVLGADTLRTHLFLVKGIRFPANICTHILSLYVTVALTNSSFFNQMSPEKKPFQGTHMLSRE